MPGKGDIHVAKAVRLALAAVLVAVSVGACTPPPDGRLTVARLEDGRWAKGYIMPPYLTAPDYDLPLAQGGKMKGDVISEEEALAFLYPPASESSSESEPSSGSRSPAPEPPPEPPSGCGVDYEC